MIRVLLLLLGVFIVSCGPKTIFEKSYDIVNPWTYDQSYTYDFEIADTSKPYDLILSVSHLEDFGYENMYIKVTTTFPNGKSVVHPLSLQLANSLGNWLGECSRGQCTTELAMSLKSYYKVPGTYKIKFDQLTRDKNVSGISSLKMQIIESQ